MKTITCSSTVPEGGCDYTVIAIDAAEAKQLLVDHATEVHADVMAALSEEDKAAWTKNFDENVWPNTPDDAPASAPEAVAEAESAPEASDEEETPAA